MPGLVELAQAIFKWSLVAGCEILVVENVLALRLAPARSDPLICKMPIHVANTFAKIPSWPSSASSSKQLSNGVNAAQTPDAPTHNLFTGTNESP